MSNEKSATSVGNNAPPRPSQSEDTSLSDHNTAQKVEPATEVGLPISPANKQSRPQSAPHSTPTGLAPPPNGGLVAWLQVLGSFLLFFNSLGIVTTFGVYQTYYESGDLFQRSSSDISWIGSLQAFLVQFSGIIAGPIYDRGYLGALLTFGGFCLVFGHMMLSLAKEYWQVLLAQGLCVGLGMGCLFVPSLSILPSYFSTRLGLAVGIASSGSALGGVIYPLILNRLIDTVGFAWSVRVIGFVALATMTIPISVMRLRYRLAEPRAVIDWTAFTDLPYMWFTISTMVGFMGVASFQFYFSFYATDQHITDLNLAFDLVPIYNAMSAVGRIIPNAIADKTGPFNILAPGALLAGVVYYCPIATHSKGPMISISILGGFFLGLLTALPPLCFVTLIKDKSRIGTRIGMGFAMISFGLLVGGPGGGAILGREEPLHWTRLWVFSGTAMTASGLMYTVLRVARSGFNPFIKA